MITILNFRALLISVVLAFLSSLVLAAPIALPLNAQTSFRQAVYNNYSKEMERGGYSDVIKDGIKPKLRILDCLGERCLLEVVTSPDAPGFDSQLFLISIRDNALVGKMMGIPTYGRATVKAAFLTLDAGKTPNAIYVMSRTHMGTIAEQLFDVINPNNQVAMQTFYNKKLQDKEGQTTYFAKTRLALRKIGRPVEF
ncbi:hypothetical protein [Collimonas humicola]|uniref:hypothetical protein n=1 Tax=Collimonas humicola TaxID=2825886 RepID=UPI001B8CA91F|nr:hypothetical protein [Collimonas humicola]